LRAKRNFASRDPQGEFHMTAATENAEVFLSLKPICFTWWD
jgi:hypothetical protein